MSPDFKPTPRVCSVTDALAVVGDRYTLELVRELFYGNTRFVDLFRQLGAPRDVLSSRLTKLVEAGVVRTRQYSERPPRQEYLLTDAGRDLMPVLLAVKEWGDRWCLDSVPTAEFTHSCGAILHPKTCCDACGEEVAFQDLTVTGGTNPPEIRAVG